MKPLAALGMVSFIVLAVVTALLWRDLRTARQVNADLRVQLDDVVARDKRLVQDAGLRRAQPAQTLREFERQYPGLATALDLSEKEALELSELLTEQARARNELALTTGSDAAEHPAAADASQPLQELQRRQEAELLAVLGTTRLGIFRRYQRNRESRGL